MICDKCGFEHNSRSVCPKCGERVVYVNEDYLKRRQEWEEAQKQGKKDALPPGIMHSTLEQRKAAKSNTGKNAHNNEKRDIQKGGPETASLSFRVKEVLNPKKIKEFLKSLAAKLIAFKDKIIVAYKRRFVKRRGADNPVIRELKFDDRPDTLDESNLVVSHKVYKDYRKIAIIGATALAAVVITVIIVVSVVKNIDRSDVLFFDGKYAYLASEPDKSLWGNLSGDIKVVYCDENKCISYDNENIYLYKNNSTYLIEAINPEIITFSECFDTIIYKSDGITYLYNDGESMGLEIPVGAEFTNATMISEDGDYFALTQCIKDDSTEQNQYKLYLGDSSGSIEVLSEGDSEIEILNLSDSGEMLYLEMSTAEFGIVNSRNIIYYDNSGSGQLRCLAENVDTYRLSHDEIYYIVDDKLYYAGVSETKLIDDEVTAFVTNIVAEDNIVYWKNGVCYEINNLEPQELCRISDSGYTLIHNFDNGFYAYYDRTEFNINSDGEVTSYELKKDDGVLLSENAIYILNKNGELIRISDKTEVIYNNVADISKVEGSDGIAFLSNGEIYVTEADKVLKIFDSSTLTDVVFARKKYYISDEIGILWEVSNKGKDKKSLGNTEIYILVE